MSEAEKTAAKDYTQRAIEAEEYGDKGLAACPYDFYSKWVNDPEATREMVESLTRETVGTDECEMEGIPNQKTAAHR